MTCLRARAVLLKVVRGYDENQYPFVVIPEGWTRERMLEYARSVHEPLGHTVTIGHWAEAELWLADPAGFTDYTTGKQA